MSPSAVTRPADGRPAPPILSEQPGYGLRRRLAVRVGRVTDTKTVPLACERPVRWPMRPPWRASSLLGMGTLVTTSRDFWRRPTSQAHAVRAHQRGRVCAHEGCARILSIYDPAQYCAAHTEQARTRHSSKVREVLEVVGRRDAPLRTIDALVRTDPSEEVGDDIA